MNIGSPATIWDPTTPGTQGCLREPVEGGVYAVLWECDHAHQTDDAALRCAKREYARQRKAHDKASRVGDRHSSQEGGV